MNKETLLYQLLEEKEIVKRLCDQYRAVTNKKGFTEDEFNAVNIRYEGTIKTVKDLKVIGYEKVLYGAIAALQMLTE